MSSNIASFVRKLLPSVGKSDLQCDLESSMQAIDSINDIYTQMNVFSLSPNIRATSKFQAKGNQELVKEFYKEVKSTGTKTRLTTTHAFPQDVVTLMQAARINAEYLLKQLADMQGEVIVSHALTVWKANVIRSVAHYQFLTRYAMDLANHLYVQESLHAGAELAKDAIPNKVQVTAVTSKMWLFARMLGVYGDEKAKFIERMESLVDAVIPKDEAEEVEATHGVAGIDLFDNLPAGFIGSPIYSVRLIFAEREASRYKEMKDKKKLLELRYLHLRVLTEQGKGDSQTDKQLQQLQKRVTDMDYELSKIEESVDD